MGMYAKLMARITESSLMDEDIPVRYTFVMLLAIADPKGYVVGTDVAIARRLNMPVADFLVCLKELMEPDPDSNSKEEDGRRVVVSDCERGYFLVNYVKYRDTRDEEHRREYMRVYMRKKRAEKDVAPVNSGKQRKLRLAKEEGEVEAEKSPLPPNAEPSAPVKGISEGRDSSMIPTTDQSKRVATIFHRNLNTPWTEKEVRAYKKIGKISEEDLLAVEGYYAKHWPPKRDHNILRHDLITFLNNLTGEVDRAKSDQTNGHAQPKLIRAQL